MSDAASTSRAPASPSPVRIKLLIGLLCVLWGSTWVVIAEGLEAVPPLQSAAMRFAIAFAVMAAITPRLRRLEGAAPPPAWLWVVVGSLNFAASYAIVYTTETVLSSGLTSVLWAIFPLMMAVSGHWLLGETMRLRQWLGLVIGLLGVATLFLTDLSEASAEALPVALLLLVSPLVSAVGQTCLKRYGSGCSSVVINRNAMGVGALWLTAAALVFEWSEPADWGSGRAWFSVAWLAVLGTVVTFSLFFWLLRHAPATQLSLIAFVTPVIALLLGVAVRGEVVTAMMLVGTGLVVAGVALAVSRR